MPVKTDLVTIALDYARVRQQREAVSTAIRLLNETASQARTAGVNAPDQWLTLRNMLDEKDSQLQLEEYDLHFKLTRSQ